MAETKSVKVYESKSAGMVIPVASKDLKGIKKSDREGLHCPPLRFKAPHKWAFGVLRLDKGTLDGSGIDEKRAVEIIEGLPDFKTAIPGVRGIWLQSDRGEKQLEAGHKQIREALNLYSVDRLKAELGRMKTPIPQQATGETDDSYKTRLENALFAVFSGEAVEPAQPSTITRGAATRQAS